MKAYSDAKLDVKGNILGTSDSYTKLLIHSNHANASESFVDSSPSNHTIAHQSSGSMTHSTAKQKFGVSSLYRATASNMPR